MTFGAEQNTATLLEHEVRVTPLFTRVYAVGFGMYRAHKVCSIGVQTIGITESLEWFTQVGMLSKQT